MEVRAADRRRFLAVAGSLIGLAWLVLWLWGQSPAGRFLSHEDLGIYHLASRLGFVVSFGPQGFRMGMRPLRKSAVYDAYKKEYGIDAKIFECRPSGGAGPV